MNKICALLLVLTLCVIVFTIPASAETIVEEPVVESESQSSEIVDLDGVYLLNDDVSESTTEPSSEPSESIEENQSSATLDDIYNVLMVITGLILFFVVRDLFRYSYAFFNMFF